MSENYIKKIKGKREKPFTTIDNQMLQLKAISWKATGLYAYLCSMPEDWKIYITDLKNRKTDGKDSVSTGMKELEALGFIRKYAVRNDKGHIDHWVTEFYEYPEENPDFKCFSPETDYPDLENPDSGFPVTTNKTITKETNNKEKILSIINNVVILDDLLNEIESKSKTLEKDGLYSLTNKETELLKQSILKSKETLFEKISVSSPPALVLFATLTDNKKILKGVELDVNRKSLAKVIITHLKEFGMPSDLHKMTSFLRDKVQPNIICRAIRNAKQKEHLSLDGIEPFIAEVKEMDKMNRMKHISGQFETKKKQTSFIDIDDSDFGAF